MKYENCMEYILYRYFGDPNEPLYLMVAQFKNFTDALVFCKTRSPLMKYAILDNVTGEIKLVEDSGYKIR